MKRKIIKPNVIDGGVAIPLGDNYYYMKGKKHKDGGIDIGADPRTGLEVEDGEIMHLTKSNAKVFSSIPFLNGKSPVEKLLGGENPNKVFVEQERYKDRNGINDDGTKARKGKQIDKPKFEDWYETVPKEINDTTNYNLRRAYELLDFNELENWRKGNSHLRSVVKIENGDYEFLKSKHHPTYNKEIEWYNSDDGKEFREQYNLDDSDEYPKYKRKKAKDGTKTSNKKLKQLNNVIYYDTIAPSIVYGEDKRTPLSNVMPNGASTSFNPTIVNKSRMDDTIAPSIVYGDNKNNEPNLNRIRRNIKYVNNRYKQNVNNRNKERKINKFVNKVANTNTLQIADYNTKKIIDDFKEILNNRSKFAAGGNKKLNPFVKRDDFLNNKRQAIIDSAIQKSYDRTEPSIPYVIKETEEEWKDRINRDINNINEILSNEYIDEQYRENLINELNENKKELANGYKKVCVPGDSCAYTTTDNYGKKYIVSGNQTFAANPEKYGFTKINDKPQKGDIVQNMITYDNTILPNHMMMYVGLDNKGFPLFNYSNGGTSENDIRKNAKYPIGNFNIYRFIGTKEDNDNWNNEYNNYRKQYTQDMINDLKMNNKIDMPNAVETTITPTIVKKKLGGTIGNRRKYKNGGVYTYTANGKTHTRMLPSTGNVTESNRKKADFGTWLDENSGYIGAGINFLTNLTNAHIGNAINKKTLKSMKYSSAPIARQATKLKTTYNINPQLSEINEEVKNAEKDINNSTISSRTALQRKNDIRNKATIAKSKLYGEKENIETELINKDRLNTQNINIQNVEDYNKWKEGDAIFKNDIKEKLGEGEINIPQMIGKGINDSINTINSIKRDDNIILANLLANPNIPVEDFMKLGIIKRSHAKKYREVYPLDK